MIRRLAWLGLLVLVNTQIFAAGIDIRLGDEAAQFEYLLDSDSQIGIGGADIGAALFFNENDDIAASLGALVSGSSAGKNRALQFGAGARLYVASLERDPVTITNGTQVVTDDDDNIAALGIGGKASYIFPAHTPMAVSLELYYAPDITSFGDNQNIFDAQARFELEIAPSTRMYVGYRKLEAELKTSGADYVLDESGHIGVRFSF